MTVETPPTEEQPRIGARQRALIILLILVAVVALLFVMLMGGDEEPDDEPPRALPRTTFTRSPSPEPTEEDDLPPENSDDFGGRDPFQPLVTAGPPPGPGGPQPIGTPTGTVGGTDADGDGAPDEVRRVGLLDVFSEDGERMATVDVDGDQFTVREGETFADSFRLLDLTRDCGTFVYGDERFTLCTGQEVNK